MLLSKSFYLRDDVVQIARDLLGKELISNIDGITTSGIIVETESYRAPDDLACHARGNILTPRTSTMFCEGGCAYVYVCYGIHHLFNVVTGLEGNANAVLIRAVEPRQGLDKMLARRKFDNSKKELVNGPGKFTKALGITTEHNATYLYIKNSPIQIHYCDYPVKHILTGPRVGMSLHTKQCAHWPWRFRLKDNKWSSKPDKVKYDW